MCHIRSASNLARAVRVAAVCAERRAWPQLDAREEAAPCARDHRRTDLERPVGAPEPPEQQEQHARRQALEELLGVGEEDAWCCGGRAARSTKVAQQRRKQRHAQHGDNGCFQSAHNRKLGSATPGCRMQGSAFQNWSSGRAITNGATNKTSREKTERCGAFLDHQRSVEFRRRIIKDGDAFLTSFDGDPHDC